MSIKESIDQVRSQLPDEALSKVGSVLENIKTEVQETEDRLSAANTESRNRKIKLREYETKIEDYDVRITELQGKVDSFDDTSLKTEVEQYKNKYNNLIGNQKQSFISSFEQIKIHPNFETAKSRFVIPDEKDGKPDWESMDVETLEKNLSALNDLNQLNYFATKNEPFPNVNNSKGGHPSSLLDAYTAEIGACKTAGEIEAVSMKYHGRL